MPSVGQSSPAGASLPSLAATSAATAASITVDDQQIDAKHHHVVACASGGSPLSSARGPRSATAAGGVHSSFCRTIIEVAAEWQLHHWAFLLALKHFVVWIGDAFSPMCRPFRLSDPAISYPFVSDERYPGRYLDYLTFVPIIFILFPLTVLLPPASAANTTNSPAKDGCCCPSCCCCGSSSGAPSQHSPLATAGNSIVASPTVPSSSHASSSWRWRLFNQWALFIVTSWLLDFGVTNAAKLMAGRYRPDFVDRLRIAGLVIDVPVAPLIAALAGGGGGGGSGSAAIAATATSTVANNTTASTGAAAAASTFSDPLGALLSALLFNYNQPKAGAGGARGDGGGEGTVLTFPAFVEGVNATTICEPQYLQSHYSLREGHLSFPSGHSGCAFANMVPIAAFFVARLRPFAHRSLWRLLLSVGPPLFVAFYISLSRTIDNRHNYSDVLGGALIGVACAFVAMPLFLPFVLRCCEPDGNRKWPKYRGPLRRRWEEDCAEEGGSQDSDDDGMAPSSSKMCACQCGASQKGTAASRQPRARSDGFRQLPAEDEVAEDGQASPPSNSGPVPWLASGGGGAARSRRGGMDEDANSVAMQTLRERGGSAVVGGDGPFATFARSAPTPLVGITSAAGRSSASVSAANAAGRASDSAVGGNNSFPRGGPAR